MVNTSGPGRAPRAQAACTAVLAVFAVSTSMLRCRLRLEYNPPYFSCAWWFPPSRLPETSRITVPSESVMTMSKKS